MDKISPRVEKLARAMCEAVGKNPDENFSHDDTWTIFPRPEYSAHCISLAILLYSPNWHRYVWPARKWLFKETGGESEKDYSV